MYFFPSMRRLGFFLDIGTIYILHPEHVIAIFLQTFNMHSKVFKVAR